MDSAAQKWFPTGWEERSGAPQLVCLPHSGSGAGGYREWPARLGYAATVLRSPYVLFGHSMGALLAFELAHALAARGHPPAHLVVSGCPAPQARDRGPHMSRLSDAELERYVRSLHGTDSAVFADRELMEMVLPIVRADFAICDGYRFAERPPLAVPLTVLAGREDRTVPPESLREWRSTTTGTTGFVSLPGGHFAPADQMGAVLDVLAGLRPAAAAPPG